MRLLLRYHLIACCLLASAMTVDAELPVPRQLENEEFAGIYQLGDIYLSGQPSEVGLGWARDQGVRTIVNLRTPAEMTDELDESAITDSLGLKYTEIPIGGEDHPYTPVAVESLADALATADGKVLIHCRTAGRASQLWAAYLVRHKGLSVPDAVAYTRQINFGTLPLEGFLGQPLVIDVQAPVGD